MHPRAAALIDQLGLIPHPEGGFYRELHRSAVTVQPLDGRPPRTGLTTIYFLLPEGAHSRWHRVASDEAWHLYEGSPLDLFQAAPDGSSLQHIVLGPALHPNALNPRVGGPGLHPNALNPRVGGPGLIAAPVHVVPAGHWQAARSTGSYTLVGCTVGPGFDFADFSFLRDAPDSLARLRQIDPAIAALA